MVRGCFIVTASNPNKAGGFDIQLSPVDDPNLKSEEKYSKSTRPSGGITMVVDNPGTQNLFSLNKVLWVSFDDIEPSRELAKTA
jgi:hypothetical protein